MAFQKVKAGEKKVSMIQELIDDQSLSSHTRLDLIYTALDQAVKSPEIYTLAQKALDLCLLNSRYKESDRLLTATVMLACHHNPNVRPLMRYGLFQQLSHKGDADLGPTFQSQQGFSWAQVFQILKGLERVD